MTHYFKSLIVFGLGISAFAHAKGVDGGGGAQIESAFRLEGYQLIAKIADDPRAGAYCSADELQSALDTTQISIVNELTDPATGKPITDLLDAWTNPHHIQLLQESWQNLVGVHSHTYRVAESVDVLILHEIFRSTGKCADDHFENSEKAYAAISGKGRSTYSEMWSFKYIYFMSHLYSNGVTLVQKKESYSFVVVCDQDIKAIKAGHRFNCYSPGDSSEDKYSGIYKNRVARIDGSHINVSTNIDNDEPDEKTGSGGEPGEELYNQLEAVTPDHPFVVVHDIQNGTWSKRIE